MNDDRSTIHLLDARWVKSSYSGTSGGECVEVAAAPGTVRVRDSKRRGHGPILRFGADSWSAFVAYARAQADTATG